MRIQNVIYALSALAAAARAAAENVELHGNLRNSDVANVTTSFHNFQNATHALDESAGDTLSLNAPAAAKVKKTKQPTTLAPTNFPTKATKLPTKFPTKKPTAPAAGGKFTADTYKICPWITGYVDQRMIELQNKNTPAMYAKQPYYMYKGQERDYAIVYYTKSTTDRQIWSTLILVPDSYIDPSLMKALYTSEEYKNQYGSKVSARGVMGEKSSGEFSHDKFMEDVLTEAKRFGARFGPNQDFGGKEQEIKWSDGTKVKKPNVLKPGN